MRNRTAQSKQAQDPVSRGQAVQERGQVCVLKRAFGGPHLQVERVPGVRVYHTRSP